MIYMAGLRGEVLGFDAHDIVMNKVGSFVLGEGGKLELRSNQLPN